MGEVKEKIPAPFLFLTLLCAGCVSRGPEPGDGVGFGGVQRDVRITGSSVQSVALRVGPYTIPLGGPEFRLFLDPGGELTPVDFDLVRVSGLGTPRLECGLVGRRIPLELSLLYETRLDGPRFEKRIRARWLGRPEQAPVLARAVLEELSCPAAPPAPGPGRPLFLQGLFLALDAPWGGTSWEQGVARIEERPLLSLQGGWWSSRAAVLGPSGAVRPELAFLRWLAQSRGERALCLLARRAEAGAALPESLAGFPLMRLEEIEAAALAAAFPAPPLEAAPIEAAGALRVALPPGLRAEDPLVRKAMQVLAARRAGAGPIVLAGLDPGGDPRALGDALDLLRASVPGREILVAWSPAPPPAPIWQLALAGQDPLEAAPGCVWLGQAGAALHPWRAAGAAWGRDSADRLMAALASGGSAIDLGVLPGPGEALAFLTGALSWARRRGAVLRSCRSLLAGEIERLAPGAGWLSWREGAALIGCRGSLDGPVEAWLPSGRSWAAVLEIYPRQRILHPAPEPRRGAEGLKILQAWEAGTRLPGWVEAWIAGGPCPAEELPPRAP